MSEDESWASQGEVRSCAFAQSKTPEPVLKPFSTQHTIWLLAVSGGGWKGRYSTDSSEQRMINYIAHQLKLGIHICIPSG